MGTRVGVKCASCGEVNNVVTKFATTGVFECGKCELPAKRNEFICDAHDERGAQEIDTERWTSSMRALHHSAIQQSMFRLCAHADRVESTVTDAFLICLGGSRVFAAPTH